MLILNYSLNKRGLLGINDQFNAYTKAIELLKSDQNILVCDVIFELATWMFKNNFKSKDIEDNINVAADLLLEIEPIFEDEEYLEDDGQSLHSKRHLLLEY
jgi:hypothetical protein